MPKPKARRDMKKHTATPWSTCSEDKMLIIDKKDQVIADCDMENFIDIAEGNAAFIVRACNSHDDLIKALKELVANEWAQDPESRNVRDEHLKEYERIIKKAEGK